MSNTHPINRRQVAGRPNPPPRALAEALWRAITRTPAAGETADAAAARAVAVLIDRAAAEIPVRNGGAR